MTDEIRWYGIAFKIISLDYDKIAWHECKKRIDFIKNDRNDIEHIFVMNSPLLDGYHVYIHFNKSLDWNKVIYLRNRWKDDGNRVVIDIQKTIPQTMMISFKSKSRNGYRYFEIPMFSESGNDFAN